MSNYLNLQLDSSGASGSITVSVPEAVAQDGATFYAVRVAVAP